MNENLLKEEDEVYYSTWGKQIVTEDEIDEEICHDSLASVVLGEDIELKADNV